jgi:hypothetical protein
MRARQTELNRIASAHLVTRQDDGSLTGIKAVVDKDASSALLAQSLEADVLLLLTDVDAVIPISDRRTQRSNHGYHRKTPGSLRHLQVQWPKSWQLPPYLPQQVDWRASGDCRTQCRS